MNYQSRRDAWEKRSMEFIDLKTQYRRLQADIDARIRRVLEHGQYILGPEVAELEKRLAAYTGSKHCIAVANGTDALLIAMMALGVGAGDEVITTPFSFISTAETIALLGAKPVFVDIDPRTYNLDPKLMEAAITPRTKAIMPVSLYGQCADMDAINAIAARHNLPVIEDGAQSFGATYKGRKSCALSTIGCTSFFPSKPLGAYGDAGACFTDDETLAKIMREIHVHGQDRRYHHPRIGINGRMDTLQAAILLAKLDTFPDEVTARSRIGARYTQLFQSLSPLEGEAHEADSFIPSPLAGGAHEADSFIPSPLAGGAHEADSFIPSPLVGEGEGERGTKASSQHPRPNPPPSRGRGEIVGARDSFTPSPLAGGAHETDSFIPSPLVGEGEGERGTKASSQHPLPNPPPSRGRGEIVGARDSFTPSPLAGEGQGRGGIKAKIIPPYIEPWNTSVYAQYTIQVENREAVVERLKQEGIPTAVHYPTPLHLQPAFAYTGQKVGSLPVSEAVAARVISLPMHPYLDEAAQQRVVEAVCAAAGRTQKP